MNDYKEKTVMEAIQELHVALGTQYMRSEIEIHLEPDAFYRLQNENQKKAPMDPISKEEFVSDKFFITTNSGTVAVFKSRVLGSNSYEPFWSSSEKK